MIYKLIACSFKIYLRYFSSSFWRVCLIPDIIDVIFSQTCVHLAVSIHAFKRITKIGFLAPGERLEQFIA